MDNEFNLFSLLDDQPKETPKEEPKQVPEEKEEVVALAEDKADKKETKKSTKKTSKATKKKTDSKGNGKTFKYPFNIYSEGRIINVDNYGFEDGQEYTDKQISDVMLKHKHYEFGGKLEFNFIEEDNVITVNAIQHKKG